MIIHIWMHWFWITTAYFKASLFFTSSCFSQSNFAEAGLLDNETLTYAHHNLFNGNDSSQFGHDPNIVPPLPDPLGPTPSPSSSADSQSEENSPATTPKPPDDSKAILGSATDLRDTFNGESLDVLPYPVKKFTNHKYGKTKPKEDKTEKVESSLKIVEEKIKINISISDGNVSGGVGRLEVEEGTSETITVTTLPVDENGLAGKDANETQTYVTRPETEVPTKNETLVIENKVEGIAGARTTAEPFLVQNRVAAATSAQNYEVEEPRLNAGSITGITLGILVVFSLFGAVSFVLYRRRYLNKPQVLHDKCSNLDSSGYIDETSLRENSEEMYSLDNDSFLNSLEAMTIQNYWTESVKHTKL